MDDDPQILRVVGGILEETGYWIAMKSSGEAAVKLLRRRGFDLVITNLNMYQTDGLAVLKKAEEQHPDTKVILFTSSHYLTLVLHALIPGFDDYLPKPCSLEELLKRVADCLAVWQSRFIERGTSWERSLNTKSQRTMPSRGYWPGKYGMYPGKSPCGEYLCLRSTATILKGGIGSGVSMVILRECSAVGGGVARRNARDLREFFGPL